MGKRRKNFSVSEAMESLNSLLAEKAFSSCPGSVVLDGLGN